MKAQNGKSYSSRFTILTDPVSVSNARKNYLIWIITGTVLFCILAAFFYYKIFLDPGHLNDQISESTTGTAVATNSAHEESEFKLYNPKPLLARLRKQNGHARSEFACEESRPRLQAIPAIFIERIFRYDLENVHDYVGLDLLLHYDNMINEFRPSYLKSIFNEYQSEWLSVKNSRDFVNFLRILNSNKFKFYSYYLKRQRLDLEIKRFSDYSALTEELNRWYNYLSGLSNFLSSYEQQKHGKYLDNCTDKNFKNYTEETQKRIFRYAYPFSVTEKKLEEINEIIKEWGGSVKIQFYNSSVLFYGRIILLSHINKQLRVLNVSEFKSVYVFGSRAVYLDENVELFGVNLAIIAPKWMFLRKVKINLNGIAGEDINHVASHDESGKPGNPGGNAGDFLGVGDLHEKFLIVSANGGKGGKGQNGAIGRDGVDGSFPKPPVDKPSACAIKINSFRNAFHQNITHYEIYSEEGCGGRGTDGGVGGRGGEGGAITLIGREGAKVRKGLTGAAGSPGKGGAGGAGGRNGCFYEVFDVDDEILHRVTRVKCPRGNVLPKGEFGRDNYNTRGQIFPPAKENLNVGNSLFQFVRVAGEAFIKHKDDDVVSFLREVNRAGVQYENVTDIISEYESIKNSHDIELFDVFREKITRHMEESSDGATLPVLKHLKSVVLGEMTVLKKNINYFFVDFKNYLNLLKKNIKNTNEKTRDFQSISYLKQKVETKREMIAESLKGMRLSALSLGDNGRDANQLPRDLGRKKFLCVTITTIDVFYALVKRLSGDLKDFVTTDRSQFCSGSFGEVENGSFAPTHLSKEESNVFGTLENLSNKTDRDMRGHLAKLGKSLCTMKQSGGFSDEENNLLEALADTLEHFLALYDFVEWEEVANLFLDSLANLTETSGSAGEEIKFLKSRLVDVMIAVQFKLATDASQQNLNHFIIANTRLHPFHKNATAIARDDVSTQIKLLQDLADGDTDPFCKNHLKAVFDKDSAVGEFYFWPNEQITKQLGNLFSGAKIDLKSSLINRHVLDKNYVQFTSVKLEFECIRNEIHCAKILSNFKVEMTHSGYSYYNWKGDTHVVVSEKVSLEYSFRTRDNGAPEVYNALFKKCQDGEIKLSPFTTWSIRLLPINDDADFSRLSTLAKLVNLRLTGTGTYVS